MSATIVVHVVALCCAGGYIVAVAFGVALRKVGPHAAALAFAVGACLSYVALVALGRTDRWLYVGIWVAVSAIQTVSLWLTRTTRAAR